jgi:Leucine-rich repeat (LRR) protein
MKLRFWTEHSSTHEANRLRRLNVPTSNGSAHRAASTNSHAWTLASPLSI